MRIVAVNTSSYVFLTTWDMAVASIGVWSLPHGVCDNHLLRRSWEEANAITCVYVGSSGTATLLVWRERVRGCVYSDQRAMKTWIGMPCYHNANPHLAVEGFKRPEVPSLMRSPFYTVVT